METNAQVILVLKLALNIAPPALYFVILGLINSQSRPHLFSSRNDWLTLMIVFCPVLLYPAVWLATGGFYLAGMIAVVLAGAAIYCSLPKSYTGWVIYNCSRTFVRRSLLAALAESGVEFEEISYQSIFVPQYKIEFYLSGFSLLRNTTISISAPESKAGLIREIENKLYRYLDSVESAINPSGPAMLIAGTTMLILPLLMMVRHIDAFVRVVSDLLPI